MQIELAETLARGLAFEEARVDSATGVISNVTLLGHSVNPFPSSSAQASRPGALLLTPS